MYVSIYVCIFIREAHIHKINLSLVVKVFNTVLKYIPILKIIF